MLCQIECVVETSLVVLFALIALTCDLVGGVHSYSDTSKKGPSERRTPLYMVLPHTNALGRVLYYLKLRDTSE